MRPMHWYWRETPKWTYSLGQKQNWLGGGGVVLGKVGGREGDVASSRGDGSQVSTFKQCTLEALLSRLEKNDIALPAVTMSQ